jgi:hypothetical protein
MVVELVAEVVILDSTSVFHADLVSLTTVEKSVFLGISASTLLQAREVDSHEIPTREVTSALSKVNRLPTRIDVELEEAYPLGCSILPLASVARYVLLLTGVLSKYPPIPL